MVESHKLLKITVYQVGESGSIWLKTAQAAKLIGLSPSSLKNYRLKQKALIEGIHWVYTNSSHRAILYNVELLSDWIATRANPEEHLRTIETYLAAQSNRRSQRRKKR